jgi:hypothetical protein
MLINRGGRVPEEMETMIDKIESARLKFQQQNEASRSRIQKSEKGWIRLTLHGSTARMITK